MKQGFVLPRQKVGLVWVSAIFRTQILLHSFLLFTFLLSPIAAGAIDITQQLHRPINSSVGRQSRDEADSLLSIGEQYASGYADKTIVSCLWALELYHLIGDLKAQGLTYNLLAKAYVQLGSLKEVEDAFRRGLA